MIFLCFKIELSVLNRNKRKISKFFWCLLKFSIMMGYKFLTVLLPLPLLLAFEFLSAGRFLVDSPVLFQDEKPIIDKLIRDILGRDEEEFKQKDKQGKDKESKEREKKEEKNFKVEEKSQSKGYSSEEAEKGIEPERQKVSRSEMVSSKVFVLEVEGAISPPVADFIIEGIKEAQEKGAKLIVILLDTPGGLDLSMRKIIQAIESSYVPVCVFVWPIGARAASAGTFITVSAHIAAMAPGTSIGAASPVMMGGREIDEKLRKKIENDAVAYIRSIAEKHGRNANWLEKAVREAATLTAEEAVKNNVVDLVAESVQELIKKINGKKVKTSAGEITLDLSSYEIVRFEPNLKHKVLKVISDPNIAYILLMIGIWGIFFELANPGAIFPGVAGAICLILGLYSLQTLPVNWAGILLIITGIILFLLEVKVASSGLLTLSGIASIILGSLMLFRSPEPFLRASYRVIISTTLFTAAFFVFVAYKGIRAQFKKSPVGFEGLMEEVGEAISDFQDGKGKIFISGEIWEAKVAEGEKNIAKSDRVKVIGRDGMILLVKKV